MDTWKYYGVTHRDHLVCNPFSEAKLDELVSLARLPAGGRVLDIACGKSEWLCRLAERYDAAGVGVDISPYEIKQARQKVSERGLGDSVEIIEASGSDYEASPGSFDLTSCLGATWIWDGYAGTLDALVRWTKPGGLIAVGEPYRRHDQKPDNPDDASDWSSELRTHHENAELGIERGLTLLYALDSSVDDWDRYEWLRRYAAETYAVENPEDPDVPELLERQRADSDQYLRWNRSAVGWAVYLYRKPD